MQTDIDEATAEFQLEADGCGALLQRDYWAAIQDCRCSPSELMTDLRGRFCEFPPVELVTFERHGSCAQPLALHEELDIAIRMATKCRVRVVNLDEQSFTLATLAGHPEAGRITFGAYRHDSGAVIFQIRSRSRSGNKLFQAGFMAFGEAMQTNTWVDFVVTVASTYGTGVEGTVHAETASVEAEADDATGSAPTFRASGEA